MQLKKEIQKRGLRQDWIAKKLGVSDAYLSLILNNKYTPKNPKIFEKIRKVINAQDISKN